MVKNHGNRCDCTLGVLFHTALGTCCMMFDLARDKFIDGLCDGVLNIVWVPYGQKIGTGFGTYLLWQLVPGIKPSPNGGENHP